MGGTPFLFMLFCCGVLVGLCLAYAHIVVLCFMEFLSEVSLGVFAFCGVPNPVGI